jgi:hypothetical protein
MGRHTPTPPRTPAAGTDRACTGRAPPDRPRRRALPAPPGRRGSPGGPRAEAARSAGDSRRQQTRALLDERDRPEDLHADGERLSLKKSVDPPQHVRDRGRLRDRRDHDLDGRSEGAGGPAGQVHQLGGRLRIPRETPRRGHRRETRDAQQHAPPQGRTDLRRGREAPLKASREALAPVVPGGQGRGRPRRQPEHHRTSQALGGDQRGHRLARVDGLETDARGGEPLTRGERGRRGHAVGRAELVPMQPQRGQGGVRRAEEPQDLAHPPPQRALERIHALDGGHAVHGHVRQARQPEPGHQAHERAARAQRHEEVRRPGADARLDLRREFQRAPHDADLTRKRGRPRRHDGQIADHSRHERSGVAQRQPDPRVRVPQVSGTAGHIGQVLQQAGQGGLPEQVGAQRPAEHARRGRQRHELPRADGPDGRPARCVPPGRHREQHVQLADLRAAGQAELATQGVVPFDPQGLDAERSGHLRQRLDGRLRLDPAEARLGRHDFHPPTGHRASVE